MTFKDEINNEYFEWLSSLVRGEGCEKLLMFLHNTEFTYSIPRDENRAEDGINLRRRFSLENNYEDLSDYLDGPCSILEMMIGLAIRCEENIMDDPHVGNRTGQWFWGMIVNLGLGAMTDVRFDRTIVEDSIYRFLNHKYEPDGRGGLFRVRNCKRDMRTVEIWYQLCWYLDSITE